MSGLFCVQVHELIKTISRENERKRMVIIHCVDILGACAKYHPCLNSAQCVDVNHINGTYHCICPLDYEGKNCSQLIEPCNSNPCLNGGRCSNVRSRNNIAPTFSCNCTEDYKGTTCEHFIGK